MQHVQIVTRCELALSWILFNHTAASLSPFTRVLVADCSASEPWRHLKKPTKEELSFTVSSRLRWTQLHLIQCQTSCGQGTHMDFLVGGAQIIRKEIILGHKKSMPCLLFPAWAKNKTHEDHEDWSPQKINVTKTCCCSSQSLSVIQSAEQQYLDLNGSHHGNLSNWEN
jgi:hypothetical protein